MTSGFAHVAPLELWPFLRHQTINIALLAELGSRAGRSGKLPVLRKILEFSKCVTNVRVSGDQARGQQS